MKIVTNSVPRLLDDRVPDWGNAPEACFTYKRETYFLSEFSIIPSCYTEFEGWDGYLPETYFSGVLVRFADDPDYVIVGYYVS